MRNDFIEYAESIRSIYIAKPSETIPLSVLVGLSALNKIVAGKNIATYDLDAIESIFNEFYQQYESLIKTLVQVEDTMATQINTRLRIGRKCH